MEKTIFSIEEIRHIRNDFPIMKREIRPGVPLIYFDSAATSQKPESVIRAMDDYYQRMNANVHRGVHTLSEEATAHYEEARDVVAAFIGARSSREIIFTSNATEAINLVAYSWGRKYIQAGDVIILTEMEHHSNLVPWQVLAQEKGCILEFITVGEDGLLDLGEYDRLLELKPKLVSFTHMSNVLGTITPAKEIIKKAHEVGAVAFVDAAQSVPHFSVDVQDIDTDLMAFSSHKMCGPTGIGVLYGKESILSQMPPFLGGGDMIKKVYLRSFTPNDLPYKFEAGTPKIAEAIGLGAAVKYLSTVGMDRISAYEHHLTAYALAQMQEIPGVKVLGPSPDLKGGVVSFTMAGVHPHDIAQILDHEGIAVRAGHHCAMPLHDRYQIPATTRASFYLYNTVEEIDKFIVGLNIVQDMFGV